MLGRYISQSVTSNLQSDTFTDFLQRSASHLPPLSEPVECMFSYSPLRMLSSVGPNQTVYLSNLAALLKPVFVRIRVHVL